MRPGLPLRALTLMVALAAAGTWGCPPAAQIKPSGPDRITDPAELMAALRAERPQALRVSGTVDMRRADKRVKAHMIYLARRPAELRFETESFFEQPLSILVTDGMQFSAWDMKNGRFIRGRATPANISQVIPVPMDGPEVAGILMGAPPFIPYAKAALAWEPDRSAYRLELSTAREIQRVWIKTGPLRPQEVILERGGQLVYRLEYKDWIVKGDRAVVAAKAQFEMPSEQIRLRIKITQAEADPVLGDDLFELVPPEGMKVELWN